MFFFAIKGIEQWSCICWLDLFDCFCCHDQGQLSYAGTTCTKSSHILNERESNHVIYINSAFETLFFLKASSMEIWISERKKSASSYLQYFKTSQLSRCESCDFQLSGEEMYSWNQEERLVSSRVLVNLFLSVAFTPLVYSF